MRLLLVPLLLAGCLASPDAADTPDPAGWEELGAWEGVVEGPNLLAVSLGPSFAFFNTTPEHARVAIDIAAEGGDITSYIFAPDCDAIECGGRAEAAGGASDTWERDRPPAGAWEVHVAKADPGAAPVSFTLVARALRAAS